MLLNNIREDFDRLRGTKSIEDVGKSLGINRQAVSDNVNRKLIVAPNILRLFDALGYDIVLTYIPHGRASDVGYSDPDRELKKDAPSFDVRRGTINLKTLPPITHDCSVSTATILGVLADEGHDLLHDETLQTLSTFDALNKAASYFKAQKKDLHSHDVGELHSAADVLTIVKVYPDGTEELLNRWAGKIYRPKNTKRGRPKKQ